jgi:hypothetical protein
MFFRSGGTVGSSGHTASVIASQASMNRERSWSSSLPTATAIEPSSIMRFWSWSLP